jgi:hypothetical protein
VDKPHERIFATALARAGVTPQEALHVGDDPAADWEGAARAGMQGLPAGAAGEQSEGAFVIAREAGEAGSGERTRPECWCWRLASTNFITVTYDSRGLKKFVPARRGNQHSGRVRSPEPAAARF